MKLARLAEAVGMDAGAQGEETVTGFAIDHRKVAPGTVFGAFQGTVVNGEDFIPAAVAAGAVAVVARPQARVEGAAHLKENVPDSELHILEGAGHCPNESHPRVVVELIEGFLGRRGEAQP